MHIFFHVPKAAGTTIREQIRIQIGAQKVLNLRGAGGLSFLSDDSINSMDLISGHVGILLLQRIHVPYRGIAFLRDPVSRVFSQYRYMQTLVNRGAVFRAVPNFRKNIFMQSLEHILLDQEIPLLESMFRNTQTWFFATDWDAGSRDRSLSDTQALDLAKKNILDRLDCFGLVEDMNLSYRLINKVFNWNLVNDMHLNACEDVHQDINPSLISLIQKNNQLDIELYDWAKRLFQKRCSTFLGGERLSITPNRFSGDGWKNGIRTDGTSNMFYFISPKISEIPVAAGDMIEFARSGQATVIQVEPSLQNGVISVFVTVDRPIDPVADGFPNKCFVTSRQVLPT